MKLTLSLATAVALLGNESAVQAFLPSSNNRAAQLTKVIHADLISKQHLSMATEEEQIVHTELNFDVVNKLPYRQLQKECKSRGLAANGSTAVLRTRLLEDLGIVTAKEEECDIKKDEEVSFCHVKVHGIVEIRFHSFTASSCLVVVLMFFTM